MPSGDIYDVFRSLASDDRFSEFGMALRREVLDGALDYVIVVDALDFDEQALTQLKEFAHENRLTIVPGQGGTRVLRRDPGS